MALRITGSVIGEPITPVSTSATGMWTSQEVAALQYDGTWQAAVSYNLTASASNVNEGSVVTATLTTTGIANGTVIPYVITGANIFANDFTSGNITGNFIIQNNSNTISFTANADITLEGAETFTITAGPVSANIIINDTSFPIDPQFPYTTLLLSGNGTNNSQNNTFLDSSTNNFTITRNGNSTQGAFTPYGGNWSTVFSSSAGDYLEISSSTAFALGTGDFTIEAWIYPFSYGGSVAGSAIFGTTGGSQAGYSLNLGESQDRMRIISNASGTWADNLVVSAGGGAPLHNWSHIAWVRNGNSMTIYKNGVSVATMTGVSSYNFTSPGNKGFIGFWWDGGSTTRYFDGYISNLRVVKGTSLYTTTFTPSTTPLTAVANTQLLTCADNRFIDDSTNNFTITRYIAPKIQRFSPFSPISEYSANTIGGSGYFDGTGDWLTTTSTSTSFNLGAGDFTIECWVYPTTSDILYGKFLFGNSQDGGVNGWSLNIQRSSGTHGIFLVLNNAIVISSGATTVSVNSWNHIAVVRSGGGSNNLKIYLNGVSVAQATETTNNTTNTEMSIGGDDSTAPYILTGYLSNARFVKGTAVYTTNFIPPSQPLTAITNTSLLCNFTNAGIIDNAMMTTLETVGDAKISTTQSKFGGSSMYFDGTGDWLVTPSSLAMALGSTFTVECWIYVIGWGGGSPLILDVRDSNIVGAIYLVSDGTARMQTTGTSTIASQSGITLNTWIHVAFVSDATSSRIYVNGSNTGATNQGQALFPTTAKAGFIGADFTGSSNFNGYIDDFRITKGYARYTANFTPPTKTLPGS